MKLPFSRNSSASKSKFYKKHEVGEDLIIFVHGLCGSSTDTWDAFPKLLSEDEDLEALDIYIMGYLTTFLGSPPSISLIAEHLLSELRVRFPEYKRIILAGHSLGGLVIRTAILKALEQGRGNDLSNIIHIITFGTPNDGSQLAQIVSWFNLSNNQIKALGVTSELINTLRNGWVNKVYAPTIRDGEELYKRKLLLTTVVGLEDNIVSPASAASFFEDPPPVVVPGDHSSLKQPEGRDCLVYTFVKGVVLRPRINLGDVVVKIKAKTMAKTDTVRVNNIDTPFEMVYTSVLHGTSASPLINKNLINYNYIEGKAGVGKSMLLRRISRLACGNTFEANRVTVEAYENPEQVTNLLTDAFETSIGFSFVSKDVRHDGFRKVVKEWIVLGKDLRKIGDYFRKDFEDYWVNISSTEAQEFSYQFDCSLEKSYCQTEVFPTYIDQELLPIYIEARYCLSPDSKHIDSTEFILDAIDSSHEALEVLTMIISSALYSQYGIEKESALAIANLLISKGKYRILVLIDGIDEIPNVRNISGKESYPRVQIMKKLSEVVSEIDRHGHQLILSSRQGDPDARDMFNNESIIEICELPDSWQYKYIHNLANSVAWKNYAINSRDVISRIEQLKATNKDIAHLTRIPVFLTGISILIAEDKICQSTSKLDVIKHWSDMLINRRVEQLGVKRFDATEIASCIATRMHQLRRFSIEEDEVFALFTNLEKEIVDNLITQSGLFYVSGKSIAFTHRLFQSYYHSKQLYTEISDDTCNSQELEKAINAILSQETDPDFLVDAMNFLFQYLLGLENKTENGVAITNIIQSLLRKIDGKIDSKNWESKSLGLLEAAIDAGLPSSEFKNDIRILCKESLKVGTNKKLKLDHRLKLQLWNCAETLNCDEEIVDRKWVRVSMLSPYVSSTLVQKADFLKFYEDIESGYRELRWFDGLSEDDIKLIQEDKERKYVRAIGGMATAMTQVSWYECNAYCKWATEIVRNGSGGDFLQLPTDVVALISSGSHELRMLTTQEWFEVAEHEWIYSNLDSLSDLRGWANTKDENSSRPLPTGIYYSSTGIFDLVGNVREWCSVTEPLLDKNGFQMAPLVGGAWNVNGEEARNILRLSKIDKNGKFGFRLSCAPLLG